MTRVALVDDDALTRQVLPLLLGAAGYEVQTFADAAAALAGLLADPSTDIVVLLDLHLGALGGLEVLAALATQRPALLPRVIVLSGADRAAAAAQVRPYPVARVLRKPVRATALQAAVAAVAEGRASAA